MDVFIARQPIFTVHKRLHAYELLYRGGRHSRLGEISGNRATTSVLSSAFITEGIDTISGSRPCFINFTRDLLTQNLPAAFPKSLLVVEILEDVPPTPEILAVCTQLKKDGYTIALDDFIYDTSLEPLLALSDIVKFDFRLSSLDTIQKTLRRLTPHKLKFLAEKIESNEEFISAVKLGFSYFQGYFFCRPENIRIREIDSTKLHLIALMAEASRKSTSLRRIEQIIRGDVGLSYKLLRYINSSYFYRLQKIDSVLHAIAYLGEKELRRFLLLVLVAQLATDKPDELVRLAIVRARMCELLAEESAFSEKSEEIFLLGLFSLLDAMLDNSMAILCEKLSLQTEIQEALVMQKGVLYPFLDTVIAYEKRDKERCLAAARKIAVPPGRLFPLYKKALAFERGIGN